VNASDVPSGEFGGLVGAACRNGVDDQFVQLVGLFGAAQVAEEEGFETTDMDLEGIDHSSEMLIRGKPYQHRVEAMVGLPDKLSGLFSLGQFKKLFICRAHQRQIAWGSPPGRELGGEPVEHAQW
jgi:predicted alpha/beta hydrolase